MNHQKSRDLCKKQRKTLQDVQRMLVINLDYRDKEVKFLDQGALEVIKCRQVLSYTYVVGFFSSKLMTEAESKLFKFQQEEMEIICEEVHKLLEQDLSPYVIAEDHNRELFLTFKHELVNKIEVLTRSYKTMLEKVYREIL